MVVQIYNDAQDPNFSAGQWTRDPSSLKYLHVKPTSKPTVFVADQAPYDAVPYSFQEFGQYLVVGLDAWFPTDDAQPDGAGQLKAIDVSTFLGIYYPFMYDDPMANKAW